MTNKTIRIGAAAATLLFAGIAAQAADFPQHYKAPTYVAPVYSNWTGFYFGINAGYGFGTSNWDAQAVGPSPKGFVGGATLGYNLQTGMWVWGLEGDFDFSTMKASAACDGFGTCETKNSWLATARGRIGYAGWNNWLPYFTGGAAFGDVKATDIVGSASKTKVGYTLGGGVEYAFMSNWSAKLEYLYVDLGKFDCGLNCGATPDNVNFKASIIRAGLNYRF